MTDINIVRHPPGPGDASIEIPLGRVPGYSSVNKYGQALDCDLATPTDIWDGADGTTSTDIWVPPTVARKHNVKSSDIADDGDPAATGMRTIRVYGLQTWASAETSEDLTLNGVTNVETANSYVIIHRMKGLAFGSVQSNVGIITATALVDATITAAIQAGEGQTLMCIYGVPTGKAFLLHHIHAAVVGTVNANIQAELLVDENAGVATSGLITKEKFYFTIGGNLKREYVPANRFDGPCIVRFRVTSSANNAAVTAAFDAYLADI